MQSTAAVPKEVAPTSAPTTARLAMLFICRRHTPTSTLALTIESRHHVSFSNLFSCQDAVVCVVRRGTAERSQQLCCCITEPIKSYCWRPTKHVADTGRLGQYALGFRA